MKPEPECASCILKWLVERIATLGRDSDCYEVVRSVSKLLHDDFFPKASVGLLANRSLQIAGQGIHNAAAYFEDIKLGNNRLARRTLPFARDFIERGNTPKEAFERACALSAAGNVAPIGAPSGASTFEEVENILKGIRPLPACQGEVYEAARRASHIFYITDNSGEIGFDSLLLERLKEMGKKIMLVVKDGPFFEDATLKEVSFFELDPFVDQVFTLRGFFVPYESPPALLDAYKKCDLVICKGTGNFEGLYDETDGKPTVFMLKVKCRPISKTLQMDIGDFAVKLE